MGIKIKQIDDIELTNPQNDDMLFYDNSQFINKKLTILENVSFYINSDDTVSGFQAFEGLITIDLVSEILSGNITNAYYEVSLDGITFTSPSLGVETDDLEDLDDWITTNITTQVFYVRTYGVYVANEEGLAVIKFRFTK